MAVLKTLPDESVDCCITSPPYFGLRDYGTGKWEGGDTNCSHRRDSKWSADTITGHANKELTVGDAIYKDVCPKCGAIRIDSQLGLEKTPDEYVAKMVEVFREVKRVLKKKGILWLNLGDSYAGSWGNYGNRPDLDGKTSNQREKEVEYIPRGGWDNRRERPASSYPIQGIKAKDLFGIPWRVAFALQADGWYLRQDIIWAKPNPMPESVEDRCTKAHEYVFLLAKSAQYFFDNEAIKEKSVYVERWGKHTKIYDDAQRDSLDNSNSENRNKRSVWTVATKPYSGAHFATFPEELIIPMIEAGCPKFVCKKCGKAKERIVEVLERSREATRGEQDYSNASIGQPQQDTSGGFPRVTKVVEKYTDCGCNAEFEAGIVMDCFAGAGTTCVVSKKLWRRYIGIELNPEYIRLAENRIETECGTLF